MPRESPEEHLRRVAVEVLVEALVVVSSAPVGPLVVEVLVGARVAVSSAHPQRLVLEVLVGPLVQYLRCTCSG